MALPAPGGRLSVEGVCSGLPGKPLLLKSVSFKADPGEAVCIIGPSAAGKSSLARLLVGVRSPQTGIVRLDGADIFSWPKSDLGRHVGYLPQDVELFSRHDPGEHRPSRGAGPGGCRRGGAHGQLPRDDPEAGKGLRDRDRRGRGPAVGRPAPAHRPGRAVLGRPRLVMLDEPNASLDGEGEEALNRAIAAMKPAARPSSSSSATGPACCMRSPRSSCWWRDRSRCSARAARSWTVSTRRNGQPAADGRSRRAQIAQIAQPPFPKREPMSSE